MVKHSISTRAVVGLGLLAAMPVSARAADVYLPIVVPVTGFMSVAGGSQRNGAVMAAQNAPSGLKVEAPVFDTGTSASGAATALDKALSDKPALAASASVFGTETVAMVPVSVGNSPRIAANNVDLPTPLRPTKPTRAPGTICAEL